MEMLEVGQAVRCARRKRGWSQARLGEAVGVPQSHIARIEKGHDIRVSTLSRIFDSLGFELLARSSDARKLFSHPSRGSRLEKAQRYGIDLGQLYSGFAMNPEQRLEAAAAAANGLTALLGR